MPEITKEKSLSKQNIHSGSLILVNRQYGYVCEDTQQLMPVCGQTPDILMQSRAVCLLSGLMEAIHGWEDIVPVSGWRSLKEQQTIWDDSLGENGLEFTQKYVAVPGHSEHQTGLAIDLALRQEQIDFICPEFPYHGICQTFRKRAAKFGFVERYPAGKESVTGIGHEPWHFRYVRHPHGVIMTELGMVLEEYLAYLKQFPYEGKWLQYDGGQVGAKHRKFEICYMRAEVYDDAFLADKHFLMKTGFPYLISGNNMDGYIVTIWKDK